MNNLKRTTLTSMEVAKMVDKEHKYLMRSIRNYSADMTGAEISPVDFWIESTYEDSKGQIRPCYLVTKKGCEFIANKLTGQKGTEFTARYINRFHEMENQVKQVPLTDNPGKVANLINVLARRMDNQGSEPYKSAEMAQLICTQYGIQLPADFVKVPKYVQMDFTEFSGSKTQ